MPVKAVCVLKWLFRFLLLTMLATLMAILSLSTVVVTATSAMAASIDITIKQASEMQLLVVEYDGRGEIAQSFARLVSYYNKENTPFDVVFPQMSIEFTSSRQWIALAYRGEAYETETVKLKTLPPAKLACAIHKGSYQSLSKTIRKMYQQLYSEKNFPDADAPLRLRYLNSPDDHHPDELLTEVQIALE